MASAGAVIRSPESRFRGTKNNTLTQQLSVFMKYISMSLTLSDFRTYIYVRNSQTVATPVRIYTYTDFAIEIWASNRHFTVSPHRPHELFTCFRSAAGRHFTACLPTEEKWSLLGVVRCFWQVLENYDCRTKFNSSLGMEYNGALYGFSAVKVKLVDSLI